MNTRPPLASRVLIATFVTGALVAYGCGGSDSSSLGGSFTQSATAASAGLVSVVKTPRATSRATTSMRKGIVSRVMHQPRALGASKNGAI